MGEELIGQKPPRQEIPRPTARAWDSSEQIVERAAAIENLIADGSLKPGQGNGLTRPLQNALRSLERGHLAAACAQLADFQEEVTRNVGGGVLTPAQGGPSPPRRRASDRLWRVAETPASLVRASADARRRLMCLNRSGSRHLPAGPHAGGSAWLLTLAYPSFRSSFFSR